MPECEVLAWEPGAEETSARYAAVWSPPDAFFQTETKLQAVFNLGAGVDHLLSLPSLPAVPLLRLEDAGMDDLEQEVRRLVAAARRDRSRGQRRADKADRRPRVSRDDQIGKVGPATHRFAVATGLA